MGMQRGGVGGGGGSGVAALEAGDPGIFFSFVSGAGGCAREIA
jgi:hypothetical protein